MNEYVRYMNMRYEMAECAEVTRQVLGRYRYRWKL